MRYMTYLQNATTIIKLEFAFHLTEFSNMNFVCNNRNIKIIPPSTCCPGTTVVGLTRAIGSEVPFHSRLLHL